MRRKNWVTGGLSLAVALLLATTSVANDYDEMIDGDLSNDESMPTLFSLDLGANLVTGTIGGGGLGDPPPADFSDALTITVGPGQVLDSVILTDYVTAGGNTTSGFNIATGSSWDGDFGAPNFLGSNTLSAGLIGTNVLDDPDFGGSLGPGSYVISLREGTPGQNYVLTYNLSAIPEPSAFGLCAVAMAAFLRRKR